MNYTLKELLDIPRLRELLDSLDEIHNMPSAIIDTEDTILTSTVWQDICTKFHRINPESNKKCIESHRHIFARLGEKSSHVVYRCPMGLIDAATPIVIEGNHLGNVFTGQLFMEPPDEAYFINQARQYGFDESAYLAAMRKVPLYPEEKLHKNLTFIRNLTQMFAGQGLQHKRQCEAEATLRENEATLRALKDTLQEQYDELQVNEESLRDHNDELLATEEMLRVQIEEFEDGQKQLKESEERFRALHDASFGGIIIHDKGRILDCNKGLSDMTGFTTAELIGMDGLKLIAPDWLECVIKNIQNGFDQRYEVEGLRRDGSVYPLAIKGKNIPYKGHEVRVIEFRDITEHKKFEQEHLKMEKLESLGILAGGIAHDFNNILTSIMGNISFAQMFLDPTHKSHKPLTEAEKASVRARELAQQLLTFARGGEPVKKLVSIPELINETVSLVLHGSNVKGTIEIPEAIHAIKADEGQISQVFHNIIINAMQAMPGGGTLTITARNETLGDKNSLNLPSGRYVCITFSDQGCGIAGDDLKRVFDPYFTTKPTGNGLGLASAHSIIIKHGGHIGVSSRAGTGTTFTIHLPSIGEKQSEYQNGPITPTNGAHTGGSILVMDDEEMIRDMTTQMLEYLGYQVTSCENGIEAITKYKAAMEAGAIFAAVIMDLTIPGSMGGKEAAEQILALDPQACLIVSSGYSNDPILADYGIYGFNGALAKPYIMAEFRQLLDSLLAV